MLSFVSKLDMFGQALPTFNLRGEDKVNTTCGGVASLIIIYITFMFASLKLMHLSTYHQPMINTYTLPNMFTSSDRYETGA